MFPRTNRGQTDSPERRACWYSPSCGEGEGRCWNVVWRFVLKQLGLETAWWKAFCRDRMATYHQTNRSNVNPKVSKRKRITGQLVAIKNQLVQPRESPQCLRNRTCREEECPTAWRQNRLSMQFLQVACTPNGPRRLVQLVRASAVATESRTIPGKTTTSRNATGGQRWCWHMLLHCSPITG